MQKESYKASRQQHDDERKAEPQEPTPSFASPEEERRYGRWILLVASELDFRHPGQSYSHEENLRFLISDDEDEPGHLHPDEHGFPNFYGYPLVEQRDAESVVYYLYRYAFEPEEDRELQSGRTAAWIRTYVTIDTLNKGEIACAGILNGRRGFGRGRSPDTPPAQEVAIPDELVFHETCLRISDLACETEAELLDLYRTIRSSRIQVSEDDNNAEDGTP